MKFYFSLCAILMLTGCDSSPLEKSKSVYMCQDRGGVYNHGTWFKSVICNDGSYHSLPKIIPDKQYWVKEKK